jgi:nitrite reductase/ring-hydroxylating ferredoxin subunit
MMARPARAGVVPPPPANRFPEYPASWYLFGPARELRRGPVTKDRLGRSIVALRTQSGRLTLMDARCAHLGADLGRGRVVGENIRCPYHGWEYAANGRCAGLPDGSVPPAFARQRVYPSVERHGFVFFFNAARCASRINEAEPLFPLPFFFGERPEDFVAGRPFRFVADCPWYLMAGNGFDLEHFRSVHDRTLIGRPEVDCPAPFARRMSYTAEITGDSVFDRLLRRFAGRVVQVTITSWGGPYILVTGTFARARSLMIIALQPRPDGQTLAEVIVLARRSRFAPARLLQPLGLWVRRLFTQGFMRDDTDRLGGIRYNAHTLIAADRLMIDFFNWLANLPQEPSEPTTFGRAVQRDVGQPV